MAPLKSLISSTLLLLASPLAYALPQNIPDSTGEALSGAVSGLSRILANGDASNIIPGRYIVVYNSTFNTDTIDAKEAEFGARIAKRNVGKRALDGTLMSTSLRSLRMADWRAVVMEADDDFITEVYNSDEVSYVEADTRVSVNELLEQSNSPPGLNRLSQVTPDQQTYVFDGTAGEGITAYVVDTGILTSHTEFEGRATFGANFVNNVVSSHMKTFTCSVCQRMILTQCARIPMRMVTVAMSLVPLPVSPLVLLRGPKLLLSRSSAPMAVVVTLVFWTACSGSFRMLSRRALPARLS
jgi:hypothetical protein